MGSLLNLSGHSILPNQVKGDYLVDLGLPSGTLWAKRNIDLRQNDRFAADEYTYEASFFSFGNTDPHYTTNGKFSPYVFDSNTYSVTPGASVPKNTNFGPIYDAARINLGMPWRIPSSQDIKELLNNCIFVDNDDNEIPSETSDKRITGNGGVKCIRLKSKTNGNVIIFPLCGITSTAHDLIYKSLSVHVMSSTKTSTGNGSRTLYVAWNNGRVSESFSYLEEAKVVRPIITP